MADLRAEMSKFMSGSGAKETASETPVEETKETVEEKVEEEPADLDQPKEDKVEDKKEAKDDEDEDKDEQDKDKKDDKPVKPNRYQRVKKQRDDALATLAQKEEHFNKAVKVANAWRQEAKLLEKELQTVISKAKTSGFERSADEERAFLSDRELANMRLEKEYDEQLKKESVHKQAIAIKERFKQEFIDNAHDLSQKYGVHPKKLMTAYYAELESGEKTTMEDVAKDMGEVETLRKRRSGLNKQIEANDGAPRTSKPGKSVGVDYPATAEGMKRWLVAQGKASKDE